MMLKNVSYFVDEDKEKEKQQQMNPTQRKQDPSLNYRVNLFVDNSNIEAFSSEVFPSPLDESKSNAFSIFTPKISF